MEWYKTIPLEALGKLFASERDELLEINFRTGRVGCKGRVGLDDFARAIAKFLVLLPEDDVKRLETTLREESD